MKNLLFGIGLFAAGMAVGYFAKKEFDDKKFSTEGPGDDPNNTIDESDGDYEKPELLNENKYYTYSKPKIIDIRNNGYNVKTVKDNYTQIKLDEPEGYTYFRENKVLINDENYFEPIEPTRIFERPIVELFDTFEDDFMTVVDPTANAIYRIEFLDGAYSPYV